MPPEVLVAPPLPPCVDAAVVVAFVAAPPDPPALIAPSVPAPVVAEVAVAPDVVALALIGPPAFVALDPVEPEPVPDELVGLPVVPDEIVAPSPEVASEPSLSLGSPSEEHAGPSTTARTAQNPLTQRLQALEHDRDSMRPQ